MVARANRSRRLFSAEAGDQAAPEVLLHAAGGHAVLAGDRAAGRLRPEAHQRRGGADAGGQTRHAEPE